MSSLLIQKKELRKQLRTARNSLSKDEQSEAAKSLLLNASQYITKIDIQRVALYLSNDSEISPHLLCEYFWQNNIETYLPVIQQQTLKFSLYTKNTIWQANSFGIPEPISDETLFGYDLDIIFLPLVGFDNKGGRLGMGGGFYDRTFELHKADKMPLLIGLAHDCQQVSLIPMEKWDTPLQTIITPTKIFEA